MPDGKVSYYIESINRKLTLIRPKLRAEKDKELVDEIIDTDLVELQAVIKKKKGK